jgi:hypothetical protein
MKLNPLVGTLAPNAVSTGPGGAARAAEVAEVGVAGLAGTL